MKNTTLVLFGLMSVMLLLVFGAGCTDNGEDEEDEGVTITVDGKEFKWSEISSLDTKTVDGNTGISLSAIVLNAGVASPDTHTYDLVGSDDYTKTVTWDFMLEGVLVEKDTLPVFPDLPNRYKVKNLVEIKVSDVKTITIDDFALTQDMPFDSWFDLVTINGTEGVQLSELINFTGLADPESHEYTITAYDDYSNTVTWDNMLTGVYVQEDHKTYFDGLSGKYKIKDVRSIEVV